MTDDPGRTWRTVAVAAGLLAAFAVGGVTLVVVTEQNLRERIEANERDWRLRGLNVLVPPGRYDNDMFSDTIEVTDPQSLGTTRPVTVYRAARAGEAVALVMTVVAPDGYGGDIHLVVGIDADGTLAGVRVAGHRETPGLGDRIEAARSDWIHGFTGRSLGDPPEERWAVRRDGGDFDQLTGATITPRAVVKAVKRALLYFERERERLFAPYSISGPG